MALSSASLLHTSCVQETTMGIIAWMVPAIQYAKYLAPVGTNQATKIDSATMLHTPIKIRGSILVPDQSLYTPKPSMYTMDIAE